MNIKGKCPKGHVITTQASNPKEFYDNNPVKSFCSRCHRLVGVWWSDKVDTVPNNWVEKWYKHEKF